jgi:hypothetical protein
VFYLSGSAAPQSLQYRAPCMFSARQCTHTTMRWLGSGILKPHQPQKRVLPGTLRLQLRHVVCIRGAHVAHHLVRGRGVGVGVSMGRFGGGAGGGTWRGQPCLAVHTVRQGCGVGGPACTTLDLG